MKRRDKGVVNSMRTILQTPNTSRENCLTNDAFFHCSLLVRTHPFEPRVDKVLTWLDLPPKGAKVDPEKDDGKR